MVDGHVPPWSEDSRFEAFLETSRAEADSISRAFDRELESTFAGLDASLPRSPKEAATELGKVQTRLQNRTLELRREFRATLVAAVPARRGSDRPTPEDLVRILPLQDIELGLPSTELSISKVTRAIVVSILIGAGVATAAVGVHPSYWQLAAGLAGAVLGGIAISIPIPRWIRVPFIVLGVAAGVWVGVFIAENGWDAALEELQRPEGWVFRSAALAVALGILAVLRISAKRQTAVRGIQARRARISLQFRERLMSDARFLSLLAATGPGSQEDAADEAATGRTADAVAVECALFLADPVGGDPLKTIRKIAGLIGAESSSGEPEPGVFEWAGTPDQLEAYRLRGIVSAGQMVRVTRTPVYREDEDGVRSVAQPGEVVRERSEA